MTGKVEPDVIRPMTGWEAFKWDLGKVVPYIPYVNVLNDAKIALTGSDFAGYYASPGEQQDAKFQTVLNVATVGTGGLLGAELKSLRGASKSFNVEAISPLLKTEPNTAFFWSGKTEGFGGAKVAAEIAERGNGTTLEALISKNTINMPKWELNKPETMKAWEDVSAIYAKQVSGEIRAVIGKDLREGNIWQNVELPVLKNNPNVTKITVIDPKTGIETVVFER